MPEYPPVACCFDLVSNRQSCWYLKLFWIIAGLIVTSALLWQGKHPMLGLYKAQHLQLKTLQQPPAAQLLHNLQLLSPP